MFFLTPKYLKQGRLYLKEAKKRLAYHRDKWSPETIGAFDKVVVDLKTALKARDREGVKKQQDALEELCKTHCPLGKDAWISENVEVFLVAIIVALGIRTYFLQPFTIPTSSMYPTLCGVIGTKTKEEPPSLPVRIWQFATHGRTWHDVVAEADETVISVQEVTRSGWRRFFTYTEIKTDKNNVYYVNDLMQPVEDAWGKRQPSGRVTLEGEQFKKGEPIVRGYTSTGDHVFVDKMSYHFRTPRRGEVFVFTTADIPGQAIPPWSSRLRGAPPAPPSQFYIKRLAGVPGDTLQLAAPELRINGKRAEETTFQRVMSGNFDHPKDEYAGYSNYMHYPGGRSFNFALRTPEATYAVQPGEYFALGDNSYHSSDSREWGTVPARNLMGPGFFVYWPFCRDKGTHFGLIE
jgi:signal peptidase I